MKLKDAYSLEVITNLDSILKSRDITLPRKVCLVKAMVFPVVMYGCKSWRWSWAPKNWCFWTMVLEKTLVSPFDCKEIQPVHSKGDQSWVFFGRTDAKDETPILWPPRVKSWVIGKDCDAGRDWGQEEKGTTEGDWTPCCYSCWPSTAPKGVHSGVRHSVLQGIWWDRSLDSWMFLGTDFIISILASPHI